MSSTYGQVAVILSKKSGVERGDIRPDESRDGRELGLVAPAGIGVAAG